MPTRPIKAKVESRESRQSAAPLVPTGSMGFEDVKETSLALDWLPPKQDGGSPITGYIIKASKEGDDFKDLGTTESEIAKVKVKDLKTGSKHVFQVIGRRGSSDDRVRDSW